MTEAPRWGDGCDKCVGGIVHQPPTVGVDPLYLERLAQYVVGAIVLCDCKAGQAMRHYLQRQHKKLVDEVRGDVLMAQYLNKNTHPEIERAIVNLASGPKPTVHGEKDDNPQD